MTVSSSSKRNPLGSVHKYKSSWENPKVQAAEFSCFKSNDQRFYQEDGMICLVNGERTYSDRSSSDKHWRISEM